MRITIALLLSIVFLLPALQGCDNKADAGPPWLLGQWHVAYNPLNDDSDILKFMPDNKVLILTEDGRKMTGSYQVRADQLLLVIDKGGRSIETKFSISRSRDRLTYRNGAFYTRADKAGAASADETKK